MAAIMYVLLEAKLGKDFEQISKDLQEKEFERWGELREKWKKDPGIEFVCYFMHPDTDHNYIFKVSSADKYMEMRTTFWESRFTLERFHFEFVVGNTEYSDRWTS